MQLIDLQDPRIERDVGDIWNRTPRFSIQVTKYPEYKERPGVLYIPDNTGMWQAFACKNLQYAVTTLQQWLVDRTN